MVRAFVSTVASRCSGERLKTIVAQTHAQLADIAFLTSHEDEATLCPMADVDTGTAITIAVIQ